MKDGKSMLNQASINTGSRNKYNTVSNGRNTRIPIAVRAIIKLIEYYTLLADNESVEMLQIKLNSLLNNIDSEQIRGGVDPISMNDKFMCTEGDTPIATELGEIITFD